MVNVVPGSQYIGTNVVPDQEKYAWVSLQVE